MKRLLVIAGEASGDLLASEVVGRLLDSDPGWAAFGIVGPRTEAAGAAPLARADDISVVGLTEVVSHLPKIANIARRIIRWVSHEPPDVALLVDLPDFNFRVGPSLARRGIPVIYLGAPQAWAWRPGRAQTMASWVTRLACLFPFEQSFFSQAGVSAHFIGHPRAHQASELRDADRQRRLVVMPGSRLSELDRHLPIIRNALRQLHPRYPDLSMVMPVAPTIDRGELEHRLGPTTDIVELCHDDVLPLLSSSQLALVASGTAVTECVVTGTPLVTFYRVSALTAFIARRLIRIPQISMANILAGESVVPELVQDQMTVRNLVRETSTLLEDDAARAQMADRLAGLGATLQNPRGRHPADEIVELIRRCRLQRG